MPTKRGRNANWQRAIIDEFAESPNTETMNRLFVILLFLGPLGAFAQGTEAKFYRGVDLSYVNEVEDFGAQFRENGKLVDPFELFARHGANLVRVRLWVDASWTKYSNESDVAKTLGRARAQGMETLLDFHYSDNWADPKAQSVPSRWNGLSDEALVQALHDYTRDTLLSLADQGLLPNLVQVGNEINGGLLKASAPKNDWDRDVALLNAGIAAVREVSQSTGHGIGVVIHVAQPQNVDWWFDAALAHGLTDFDWIGLSYYPQWTSYSIADLGEALDAWKQKYGRQVLVVETGAPWTLDRVPETASNVMTQGIPGYPIRPAGQRDYLVDLVRTLAAHNGGGLIYWEPAWVSTKARTRWGQGSHWENATFFDFRNNNEVLPAIDFLSADLSAKSLAPKTDD